MRDCTRKNLQKKLGGEILCGTSISRKQTRQGRKNSEKKGESQ